MRTVLEALLFAALIIVGAVSIRSCQSEKGRRKSAMSIIAHKGDSLRFWRDKAGSEHADKVLAEAQYAAIAATYRKDMDSIAKRLSVKPKQINSFSEAATTDSGHFVSVLVPIYIHDTTLIDHPAKSFAFEHKDRWLTAWGYVDSTVVLNYAFTDSITITSYWRRKWFGGRKTVYVDGYSLNPQVTVSGLTSVKIDQKQPSKFGIGLFGGIDYTLRPTVAIGIYYSLFNF